MKQPVIVPRSHVDFAFDLYQSRQREAVETYQRYLDLLDLRGEDKPRLDRISYGLNRLREMELSREMFTGHNFTYEEVTGLLQVFDRITHVSPLNYAYKPDDPILHVPHYLTAQLARKGLLIAQEDPSTFTTRFYPTEWLVSLLLMIADNNADLDTRP